MDVEKIESEIVVGGARLKGEVVAEAENLEAAAAADVSAARAGFNSASPSKRRWIVAAGVVLVVAVLWLVFR